MQSSSTGPLFILVRSMESDKIFEKTSQGSKGRRIYSLPPLPPGCVAARPPVARGENVKLANIVGLIVHYIT